MNNHLIRRLSGKPRVKRKAGRPAVERGDFSIDHEAAVAAADLAGIAGSFGTWLKLR